VASRDDERFDLIEDVALRSGEYYVAEALEIVCSATEARLTELIALLGHLHLLHDFGLLALEPVQVGVLLLEDTLLPLCHLVQDSLEPLRVDCPVLVDIAVCAPSARPPDGRTMKDRPNPGSTFL
jgi:hypothetical protein